MATGFVIWDEQNKILPVNTGEAFIKRALPDRFEIIKDCGHLVMREKPELVNELLTSFLG